LIGWATLVGIDARMVAGLLGGFGSGI
jgi:hypothetical protein